MNQNLQTIIIVSFEPSYITTGFLRQVARRAVNRRAVQLVPSLEGKAVRVLCHEGSQSAIDTADIFAHVLRVEYEAVKQLSVARKTERRILFELITRCKAECLILVLEQSLVTAMFRFIRLVCIGRKLTVTGEAQYNDIPLPHAWAWVIDCAQGKAILHGRYPEDERE